MRCLLSPLVLPLLLAAQPPTTAQPGTAPQSALIQSLLQSAQAKIHTAPKNPEGWSDLAFAYSRRARETENPADRQKAEQAVLSALALDPSNFAARKARVIVRIEEGRLRDAEEEGVALNRRTPDDNLLYGLLADIALAQGDYSRAEALTQKMLDLRQVNGPALQRAAQVREIIGDAAGASEFWTSALNLASSSDTEEKAFILTRLAGLSRRQGRLEPAVAYAEQALALEPEYPAALLEQARIALDRERPDESLAFSIRRLQLNESLDAHYWSTLALEALGRKAEAKVEGDRFLNAALALTGKPGNRDALLLAYLTLHGEPARAAALGPAATSASGDVDTREAYAMALLAAGQTQAARQQMDRVLASGVRNPLFFLHAAQIRTRAQDSQGARAYLKQCIEVNATSTYASTALDLLQHTP